MDLSQPPKTTDGKPLITANAFPESHVVQMIGAADDADNGRGEGAKFQIFRDADGEAELEWSMIDHIHMVNGVSLFKDAVLGDWAEFKVYAKATTAVENPTNTGNCNRYEIPDTGGTLHMLLPAAGDGTHDIVLADAVPVPNAYWAGYWDCALPEEGAGAVTPNVTATGRYDLYDFAIDLNRFAVYCPLLGSGKVVYGVEVVKAATVLPQWTFKVRLHNEGGGHVIQMGWYLVIAREKTVG